LINETIDAYERVSIQPARQGALFLYVCHFVETNHLQVGFGMESRSGLQVRHIAGPLVHQFHSYPLTDWLRRGGRIMLTDEPLGRIHPFSSTLDIDLVGMLPQVEVMPLSANQYLPHIDDPLVDRMVLKRFADAIERVHIKAWGHPRDWDVRHHELRDGRFVWMAYDSTISKIRIGIGFHDQNNEKVYGDHTYAVAKREVVAFTTFHHYYLDAPIQFMGVPARWPHELSVFLTGPDKQAFARTLVKLADEVWPGEVGVPAAA
jgi:hypothetical protein